MITWILAILNDIWWYIFSTSTVSSTGIHALGDGSSDCSVTNDFSPSLKKESNGKFTYTLKR